MTLVRDLRYAVRGLMQNPGLTLAATLTLSLGIGANTALFSVVNGVLLRPLSHEHADRLVMLWEVDARSSPVQERSFVSVATFGDWRAQSRTVEQMAAFHSAPMTLVDVRGVERVTTGIVSSEFLGTVGTAPILGRGFADGEDEPGRRNVAMLSYELWQRRYGGDAAVVDTNIQVDGESVTIIGVLPPGFDFLDRRIEAWIPISLPASDFENRRTHRLQVVGRLRADATLTEARAELGAITDRLRTTHSQWMTGFDVNLVPLQEEIVGRIRPALLVLLGAVAFVLLIALVNVASLLLGRASARRREMSIRTALGAERRHLVQQALTEGLVLAALGGGGGLLMAHVGTRALLTLDTGNVPRTGEIGIDGTVLAFTMGLSLAAGLFFSLAPSMQGRVRDLGSALKDNDRATTGGRAQRAFRGGLIVAEIALSLVLLVGAGLMIRTVVALVREDPGFQSTDVLTASVELSGVRYADRAQVHRFFEEVTGELRRLPGVDSVGATRFLPLGGEWTFSFFIRGQPLPQEGEKRDFGLRLVDTRYFGTMEIRLIRGRTFTDRDYGDAPPTVVANEAMARRFWPGTDPVGQWIRFGSADDEDPTWIEVVGIVADVKHAGLDIGAPPALYAPYAQNAIPMRPTAMTIVARAANPTRLADELRRIVGAKDPELLVADVATMDEVVTRSFADRRLLLVLLGIFAGMAVILAAVGIYGVMAHSVVQRMPEIGLRMALGATPGGIVRLILGGGMRLVLLGLAVGSLAAAALTRGLASLVFGVGTLDPVTFVSVAVLLGGVGIAACSLPALRASTLNPIETLRAE